MPEPTNPESRVAPLIIGVTGHRDLIREEQGELQRLITDFIAGLRRRFPSTPIRMMSALAEGADRLAAKTALSANVSVQAILPMPAAEYSKDFVSTESQKEFEDLCGCCEVLTLPVKADVSEDGTIAGSDRDLLYANAGMFISAHCHILLAVWDGINSDSLGGTSQIIYFHHYDRLPGIAEIVPRTSLFLTDDESDLVYHIACSRQLSADNPEAMRPLQCRWFTTDPDAPRVESMPTRYDRVFERMESYNHDIRRRLRSRKLPESSEASPPDTATREAAMNIRNTFDVADWLANHFQQRVNMTLAGIYALAFLTGITFILYSELSGFDPLIYAFLAFLLTGLLLGTIAKRREWHRKYLDYRVLAEGVRVQFYRSVAGIQEDGHTKFAYDNFLRQRDMDLGWIRNVMRAAGTLSDANPPDRRDAGLEFAIEHWIGGNQQNGQLDYYRAKAVSHAKMNRTTDVITWSSLWGGISIAFILAFFLQDIGGSMRDPLIVLMGVLPLIAGIAEVYTQRKADRELTKQYRFMENVFSNARRRLNEATTDDERREVLQGLGDAALSEHAEWILVHRERQPDSASL